MKQLLQILVVCLLPCTTLGLTFGQSFTGKVVGITDGDTLSVMNDGAAVKIPLHGIDCPEKGQPFTNRAKQFTSSLALRQDVTVQSEGLDRFGRTIGTDVIRKLLAESLAQKKKIKS